MRILIIEDEQKVAAFIQKGLEQEGYAVDVVRDGEEGAYQAENFEYDAAIVDLMLPKLPGLDLLKRLRGRNLRLPVLILSAKGAVEDKVAGLDAGANDYLVKPFAFAELSARVRALLRRGAQESTVLRLGDLEMNTATRTVTRAGRKIDLKLKEFSLLEFLLRNARRTVTRTMIIEHVWDIHFDSVSNVVDVHINTLRNKIDREFPTQLIHTIRGVGYMLTDEPS
ncbi:MAG: response regulator transcription factor [Candidatus Acidiferrum sp.]|jgi:DNA-binding response OmpR family regulator